MKIQRDISADSVLVQDLPPLEPSAKTELLSAIALFQAALDGVPPELPDESQPDLQHEARQRARDEAPPLVLDMASPQFAPPAFGSAPSGSVLPDLQHASGTGNPGVISKTAAAAVAVQASVPATVLAEGAAQAAVDGESQGEMHASSSPLRQTVAGLAPSMAVAARPAPAFMPAHSDADATAQAASAQGGADRGAMIPAPAGAPLPDSAMTAVTVAPLLPPAATAVLATPDHAVPGALSTPVVVPATVPQSSGTDAAESRAASERGDATGEAPWEVTGASTGSPLPASGSVPFANFRAAEGASNSIERVATLSDRPRVPQHPAGLVAAPAGATHSGLTTGVPAASAAPISLPVGAGAPEVAGSAAREMAISIPSLPGTTLYASVQNGQLAMQIVSSNASFVSQLKSLLPEIESAFNRFAGRSVQISASSRRGPAPAEGESSELRADADGVSSNEDPDTQTA